MFIKRFLALFTTLVMTITCGTLPAFSSDNEKSGQPVDGMVAEGFATSSSIDSDAANPNADDSNAADSCLTSLETVFEKEEEPEFTFEVKDPYDLDGMQRVSTYMQKVYNASGFTGEGSYLYGGQLPPDSAAKMVYSALKDAWLGVDPSNVEKQVTVEFGDKKIPMRTTVDGVYTNSSFWDRQSLNSFQLATQCAIDAFLYDFPDIFWMKFGDGGMRYSAGYQSAGDGINFYIVSITVTASLIDNASSYYRAVDNKIDTLSAQFAYGASNNATKIKSAHNYIASNIEYGYTNTFGDPHTRTPYGALFGDNIVCEGYARTFKLFCDRFDIPCVLVMGYAEPQHGLHMWNAVKLDGNWYLVDVTWDDLGGGGVSNTYFLAGLDTVVSSVPGYTTPRKNHVPEGILNSSALVFTYPSINSTAYSTGVSPSPPSNQPSGSSGKGSGGGGGGGGGNSGSSGSALDGTIVGIVQNKPMEVTLTNALTAVKDALDSAKASGSGTANVRFKNPSKITLEVLREIVKAAGMPVKLTADSMSADGKSVEVRISLDPSKITTDLDLSASISDNKAIKINNSFSGWFKNTVQSVSLAQKNPFGQEVVFFVKLDSKMDKANLKFYSYDGKAYTLLPNQKHSVTKSGYVKFYADPAGNIIISSGSLVSR